MIRIAIIILLCSIGCLGLATAESSDFKYAGKGSKTTVYYPSSYVQGALRAFYRAHGRWPTDWAEVLSTGMLQVPLLSPAGEIIDPGDGKLDFRFDVFYDAAATHAKAATDKQSPALIRSRIKKELGFVETIELPVLPTYRQTLMTFAPKVNRDWRPYVEPDALKLMMAAAMMGEAILAFHLANDRYPNSVEEFLASGLAPLDYNSLNPVTGQPFRLDGSPNDLLLISRQNPDGLYTLKVEPVDAQGEPFRILYPY